MFYAEREIANLFSIDSVNKFSGLLYLITPISDHKVKKISIIMYI